VFAFNQKQIQLAIKRLKFPLLVKHFDSSLSVGLQKEDLVHNDQALIERSNVVIKKLGGALIEEFIQGREFSVFVMENILNSQEPLTFTPLEYILPKEENFMHNDVKWGNDGSGKYSFRALPSHEHQLALQLKQMAKKIFVAMTADGYARCDIRMNERNELYLLEVNANCSLLHGLDKASASDQMALWAGVPQSELLTMMLQLAFHRQRATWTNIAKAQRLVFATLDRPADWDDDEDQNFVDGDRKDNNQDNHIPHRESKVLLLPHTNEHEKPNSETSGTTTTTTTLDVGHNRLWIGFFSGFAASLLVTHLLTRRSRAP